jgi:hypothetical protein
MRLSAAEMHPLVPLKTSISQASPQHVVHLTPLSDLPDPNQCARYDLGKYIAENW